MKNTKQRTARARLRATCASCSMQARVNALCAILHGPRMHETNLDLNDARNRDFSFFRTMGRICFLRQPFGHQLWAFERNRMSARTRRSPRDNHAADTRSNPRPEGRSSFTVAAHQHPDCSRQAGQAYRAPDGTYYAGPYVHSLGRDGANVRNA